MEKDNNRIVIIYFLLLFIFITGSLVVALLVIPNYFREYARITSLLVWVGLFVVSTQLSTEHGKFKAKSEKIKITLIIILIYYILYFLVGLILGFKTNPYSRVFSKLIENIVFVVGLSLIQEYIRAKMINNQKRLIIYILVTIIFFIINMDINKILYLVNSELVFKYIFETVITGIAISGLCTYLGKTGGFQLIYAYIIPVKIAEVVIPVFPNMDWFLLTVSNLILVIVLIFYNKYEHTAKTKRMTRRELRNENPKSIIPIMIILLLLVGFIAGIFPVKPVAVMSNSMKPIFSRGYVLFSKKINGKFENIKEGDIIEFKSKKGIIIHKVVFIEKDEVGKFLYTTKGDNNLTIDPSKVSQDDVLGIVIGNIPYLGYPSVLFYEKVLGKESLIEIIE